MHTSKSTARNRRSRVTIMDVPMKKDVISRMWVTMKWNKSSRRRAIVAWERARARLISGGAVSSAIAVIVERNEGMEGQGIGKRQANETHIRKSVTEYW